MNVLRTSHSSVFPLGFTVLILLAFVSGAFAQDILAGNTVMNSSPGREFVISTDAVDSSEAVESLGTVDSSEAVYGPVEYYEESPCSECDCEESSGRARNTLRQNLSNTACFNCRTNGSYKFPVPRQYMYFWPGIYSQKTMTEYVAPYQGLKLRTPSEVFDDDTEIQ